MSHRALLLEHERRKVLLLRHKLADAERRVRVLEELAEDDPLDAILDRELAAADEAAKPKLNDSTREAPDAANTPPQAPSLQWKNSATRLPRRVPPQWVQLIRYIGEEGKSYQDVTRYIRDRNLPLSEGAARAQLMNYRKDFGFIENPKKGLYRATERALAFIARQEGESPTVSDGGASRTQPTPLTRAAA